MKKTAIKQPSWWGSFTFSNNQCLQWRIGPLTLIVRCLPGEWQIAYERTDDLDNNHFYWEVSETDVLPESLGNMSRYIFRETSRQLNVNPLLADRPVISRPNTPFNLVAGEEVTLYVSSPLWMELTVGTPPKKLEEIAIQRASDTWFGPSTLEGELCYSSTTLCRLDIEELPQRPHRAISPVVIRNKADSTLPVERLNVPAPLLPLYTSSTGQLWTSKITLMREKEGDRAALNVDKRSPKEAGKVTLIRTPRKTASSGALIRAFHGVFN